MDDLCEVLTTAIPILTTLYADAKMARSLDDLNDIQTRLIRLTEELRDASDVLATEIEVILGI